MRTSASLMLYVLLSIVLLCAIVDFSDAQTDYCSPSLCRRKPHIACNNTGAFGPKCESDAEAVPMTNALKSFILDKHNKLRNTIAGGGVGEFKPAARMATIQWDKELEYLALLNAKQCNMVHDICRSTEKFPHSGQNLGYFGSAIAAHTVEWVVDRLISIWYNEKKNSNWNQISNFKGNGKAVAHFTEMMLEKANYMGCGFVRHTLKNKTFQYFACNYAFITHVNRMVYEGATKSGSKCKTGTNPSYTSLCSVKELYDVNKV